MSFTNLYRCTSELLEMWTTFLENPNAPSLVTCCLKGLQVTHVVHGCYLVPLGTKLVTPVLEALTPFLKRFSLTVCKWLYVYFWHELGRKKWVQACGPSSFWNHCTLSNYEQFKLIIVHYVMITKIVILILKGQHLKMATLV